MGKQRLELTWIGKYTQPKLEPRILIEDTEKSFGTSETHNMLIHGDNLLALKALENEYSGKIKCVYIDPPYNTGQAFKHYEDGLEHSLWLNLMKQRLIILYNLLREDGSIWVQCDDYEQAYLKVLLDEIFGRDNFITTFIWRKVDSPNDNKMPVTPDHEYILCYGKKNAYKSFKQKPDLGLLDAYKGPDDQGRFFRDRLLKKNGKNSLREDRPSMYFPIIDPDGNEIYPVHDDGRDARWALGVDSVRKLIKEQKIIWKQREKNNSIVWVPYTREYANVNPTRPWPTIWNDVDTTRQTKAHQKSIFSGIEQFDTPKPENLIERIIYISSEEDDYVLDSFLGSGTTSAVSHKMNRKWIGIELGDHCYTHCKTRLDKVISGEDSGGISKSQKWNGGGGYKFYELAPSLLNKDTYGNWIINQDYNAEMLAAAMAKQEGFSFNPDADIYWKQGQSTEQDFIFTTTEFLTQEHLVFIHSQMKDGESLLICCKAFNANDSHYPNITIKKIPKMLMGKCEFGKDDYSLNIINIPTDDNEEDSPDTVSEAQPKYVAGQGELFDLEGDDE